MGSSDKNAAVRITKYAPCDGDREIDLKLQMLRARADAPEDNLYKLNDVIVLE
jgi:hypothetical protein